MNWPKHLATAAALGISLFLIFSQTLYASVDTVQLGQSAQAYYIDPGTGSIIIQVLIGSFVAGLAMVGVYRMRVKNFFTSLFTGRRHGKQSDENKESEQSN